MYSKKEVSPTSVILILSIIVATSVAFSMYFLTYTFNQNQQIIKIQNEIDLINDKIEVISLEQQQDNSDYLKLEEEIESLNEQIKTLDEKLEELVG